MSQSRQGKPHRLLQSSNDRRRAEDQTVRQQKARALQSEEVRLITITTVATITITTTDTTITTISTITIITTNYYYYQHY